MRLLFALPLALYLSGVLSAQSERSELWWTLEQFSQTYGYSRDQADLKTVLIEGQLIQGGQAYEFTLRKRRPDSIRYTLARLEHSITIGFDGVEGWQRITTGDKVQVRTLNKQEVAMLTEEADFEGPLLRHLRNFSDRIHLRGNERVDGELARIVEIDQRDGSKRRYFLSESRNLVLRCELLNAAGACLLQTNYRDYRWIETFPFAFEVDNRVDAHLISTVKVERVQVNKDQGLLSIYFKKPRG